MLGIGKSLNLPWLEAEARQALGFAAERQAEFARAGDEYRKASAILPERLDLVIAQGRVLAREGRHTEALALLDPLCLRHPENAEAGVWRALALRALGRTAESFAAAAAAALKAPPPEIAEPLASWKALLSAPSSPAAVKDGN